MNFLAQCKKVLGVCYCAPRTIHTEIISPALGIADFSGLKFCCYSLENSRKLAYKRPD